MTGGQLDGIPTSARANQLPLRARLPPHSEGDVVFRPGPDERAGAWRQISFRKMFSNSETLAQQTVLKR
jgi:hypothetical protein